MPPGLYLVVWIVALFMLAYVPAHQTDHRPRHPVSMMKPDTNLAPDNRQRGFWWRFVTQTSR